MQTVDMIHQITQGATGITVPYASTEFKRFSFERPEGNEFGGDVKFDAQKLGTMIQDKTLDFIRLMGNYAEVSNTDVQVIQFPSSLSAEISGSDIDLQFDTTGTQDANGDDLSDIADASFIIMYRFMGGAAPAAPFPDCGQVDGQLPEDCASSSCL